MTPTPQLFETYKTEAYSDFSKAENTAAYKAALEQVRSQLGRDYPLIIGSEKIETGEWLSSVNPSNLDVMVGRTAMAKRKDIEKTFNAAYKTYEDWSRLTYGTPRPYSCKTCRRDAPPQVGTLCLAYF